MQTSSNIATNLKLAVKHFVLTKAFHDVLKKIPKTMLYYNYETNLFLKGLFRLRATQDV